MLWRACTPQRKAPFEWGFLLLRTMESQSLIKRFENNTSLFHLLYDNIRYLDTWQQYLFLIWVWTTENLHPFFLQNLGNPQSLAGFSSMHCNAHQARIRSRSCVKNVRNAQQNGILMFRCILPKRERERWRKHFPLSFDVLVINILMGPGCATGVCRSLGGGNIEKSARI